MNRNKIIIMSAMSKAHKHSPAELPESKEQSVRVMRYLVYILYDWVLNLHCMHRNQLKDTQTHTQIKWSSFGVRARRRERERVYSAEFQQVWYSLIICICECVFR